MTCSMCEGFLSFHFLKSVDVSEGLCDETLDAVTLRVEESVFSSEH